MARSFSYGVGMTSTASRAARISLPDIARLAGVQRPVVSMWRRRPKARGGILPFPEAVGRDGAQELFDLDEVLAWLERTGRGNSATPRLESALVGRATEDHDPTVVEALWTLMASTGVDLADLSDDEVLDLADATDPDDVMLLGELEAAAERLQPAVARAVAMSEAAYGPAAAWRHARRPSPLSSSVSSVLAPLVESLVGSGTDVLQTTSTEDLDLVLPIVSALPEGTPVTLAFGGADDVLRRGIRRAAVLTGCGWTDPATRPCIRVADVGADGRVDIADALRSAELVQLELDEGDFALVVGPASALCDALADSGDEVVRGDVIRSGRLRCVVRLPVGLARTAPRAALALWILGPDTSARAAADRVMAVADLSDHELNGTTVEALVWDLVLTLGPGRDIAAHAYSLARVARTSALLAGRGALVERGVRPRRSVSLATEAVLDAREAARSLTGDGRSVINEDSIVERRLDPAALVSLDSLLQEGAVRLLSGSAADFSTGVTGSVPVVSAGDVLQHSGGRLVASASIDPLTLEALAPRAHRTEPGDVVFVTAPRPAAVVDRDGRSVVRGPARILRCREGSGVSPEAVAVAVTAREATDRQWRAWPVLRTDADDAARLSAGLRLIEDERDRIDRRRRHLDDLARTLTTRPATIGAAHDPMAMTPTEGR